MTFEEKAKELMISYGMFDTQADAVIALCKEKGEDEFPGMRDRWRDDIEGYPEMLFPAIWNSIKRVALEWLEENKPEAWFKPMFMEEKDWPEDLKKQMGV